MTPEEMLTRIAALEAQLSKPRRIPGAAKAAKLAQRARRRQFKIEAFWRKRRHLSLNRYAIQH